MYKTIERPNQKIIGECLLESKYQTQNVVYEAKLMCDNGQEIID